MKGEFNIKDNIKASKVLKGTFESRMAKLLNVKPSLLKKILKPSSIAACRLNLLKGFDRYQVIEHAKRQGVVLTPISFYKDGFLTDTPKYELINLDLVKDGILFIQNASSYLPVLALDPKPNEEILDACAAPGGKSSFIASLTLNKAKLWLNDGIKSRLEGILQLKELLKFEYEVLTNFPVQRIDKEINKTFDKILLDVQCSGEGMIDLNKPSTMKIWSLERIEKYMYLQQKALNATFKLLKPGGTLVYSTCTFAPEENEMPISNFLKHNLDATIEPLILNLKNVRQGEKSFGNLTFDPRLQGALRVLPSDGMEGFFVCRIRKKVSNETYEGFELREGL